MNIYHEPKVLIIDKDNDQEKKSEFSLGWLAAGRMIIWLLICWYAAAACGEIIDLYESDHLYKLDEHELLRGLTVHLNADYIVDHAMELKRWILVIALVVFLAGAFLIVFERVKHSNRLQNKINELDDETVQVLDEYRALTDEVDALKEKLDVQEKIILAEETEAFIKETEDLEQYYRQKAILQELADSGEQGV